MNYSIEEWKGIIQKCDVLEKLRVGVSYKALAVDLKESGYPCSADAVRKAVRRIGYKKSIEQNLYYHGGQEWIIKFMNSIDIEGITEEIAISRYYDCFKDWGFWTRDESEKVTIEIDKQIFEEYKNMSNKLGCDFDEEYMIYVLLHHLNLIDPKEREEEFTMRAIEENEGGNFTKKEKEFIFNKVKEGYSLFELYSYSNSEGVLTELTREEFEKFFKKKRIDREEIK